MRVISLARRPCAAAAVALAALAPFGPGSLHAQDTARWDITQTFGPTRTLSFETDEATWVNVAVSPDGRTVLFDVLGDIYSMPIGGTGTGLATRITG
jgi:hypothetical protein